MNLTIQGHHVAVTPAMRQYVIDKLARVWAHFDQVVDVDIILSVEKLKEKALCQKIVVTARYPGKKPIVAEQCHADLYAAIDMVADKLNRQVVQFKSKVQNHHHVSAKRLVTA